MVMFVGVNDIDAADYGVNRNLSLNAFAPKTSDATRPFEEVENGEVGQSLWYGFNSGDKATTIGAEKLVEPVPPSRRGIFDLTCYPRNGAGTHVYVIDTGCRTTHEQLKGRATA
jgi:hypothetical protein